MSNKKGNKSAVKSAGTGTQRGTVKWFNAKKGYGFITQGDEDIFVHYTGLNMEGYKSLDEGAEVTFDITEGKNGPQAINVDVM